MGLILVKLVLELPWRLQQVGPRLYSQIANLQYTVPRPRIGAVGFDRKYLSRDGLDDGTEGGFQAQVGINPDIPQNRNGITKAKSPGQGEKPPTRKQLGHSKFNPAANSPSYPGRKWFE
jgi:hypothetical protein